MMPLIFENPPDKKFSHAPMSKWIPILEEVKKHPKQWIRITEEEMRNPSIVASNIKLGKDRGIKKGEFETRSSKGHVYVRYHGMTSGARTT